MTANKKIKKVLNIFIQSVIDLSSIYYSVLFQMKIEIKNYSDITFSLIY